MTQIKTINTGKAELVLVELPEGFASPRLRIADRSDMNDPEELVLRTWCKGEYIEIARFSIESKVGSIGLFPDLTEEQCRELVDSATWHFPTRHIVYRNYQKELSIPNKISGEWRQEWNVSFNNATESMNSLILNHKLNPDRTLILKKL